MLLAANVSSVYITSITISSTQKLSLKKKIKLTRSWIAKRSNFLRCTFNVDVHVIRTQNSDDYTHPLKSRRKGELADNSNFKWRQYLKLK